MIGHWNFQEWLYMDRIFKICTTFKFSEFVAGSLLSAGGPNILFDFNFKSIHFRYPRSAWHDRIMGSSYVDPAYIDRLQDDIRIAVGVEENSVFFINISWGFPLHLHVVWDCFSQMYKCLSLKHLRLFFLFMFVRTLKELRFFFFTYSMFVIFKTQR